MPIGKNDQGQYEIKTERRSPESDRRRFDIRPNLADQAAGFGLGWGGVITIEYGEPLPSAEKPEMGFTHLNPKQEEQAPAKEGASSPEQNILDGNQLLVVNGCQVYLVKMRRRNGAPETPQPLPTTYAVSHQGIPYSNIQIETEIDPVEGYPDNNLNEGNK